MMKIGYFNPELKEFQTLNQQQVSLEKQLMQAQANSDEARVKKLRFDLSATKIGIYRLLENKLGIFEG
ncbi:MAG: hypothetical protein MUC28_00250 [Planctomycetes bacterium]|jgi:hypothetical protein|nr:hypothetical protein [Planctomycetota bacterium]